jgi:hypothetical protein
MPIETKELTAGLAFFQDGKRVKTPKAGNCAVRPIAGGAFVKANGQEVLKALRDAYPTVVFLFLSKPVEIEKPEKPEKE